MQKIINAIAISSGVVSLALIAGGVGVYVNRGKIIDSVKSQVMEQVSGALGSSLGGMVPDVTGPAQQAPSENPLSLPVPVPMP
tara:strand:- start:329 stop:577 length:249 start_codon:yes stop_codon:yes gene_type:complete